MNILRFAENGPVLIEPKIFKDERGYFYESFNESEFKQQVADITFVQDNESKSNYGVLRGLHFQKPPYAQSKLVRVIKGAVLDIVVDIRKGSPTYGKWFSVYLSEENHRQFFVPQGFAHGFISLRDDTVFQYKCDNFYNPESEGGISFSDPSLGIPWGIWIPMQDLIISEKDKYNINLDDFNNPFEYIVETDASDEQGQEDSGV